MSEKIFVGLLKDVVEEIKELASETNSKKEDSFGEVLSYVACLEIIKRAFSGHEEVLKDLNIGDNPEKLLAVAK